MEVRLGKYLADCGVAARRKADVLIEAGRVRVNGKPAELGMKVQPGKDRVTVDGRTVKLDADRTTLMLYKPKGYVTTVRDPEGRPTVMQLLPKTGARLFPVGRLDLHSEGLLLFTNDGDLAQRLTHPSSEIEREYEVWVHPDPKLAQLAHMRKGVRTDALGEIRVKRAERLEPGLIRVVLTEGKKREIREICKKLELKVEQLTRVRFGGLLLGKLKPGEWRTLSDRDVKRLFEVFRG